MTRSYQLRYIRPKSSRAAVLKSEFVEGQSQPPTGPASEHFSILAALDGALSDTGDLTFIESQNVILVRDTTQVHETIQEILRRLDVEPGQIFVDLKFVSTANSDLLNLGVDYGDEGARVSISGGQIPIELPFSMGEGGWEDSIIASDTGFGPYAGNDPAGGATNAGITQVPRDDLRRAELQPGAGDLAHAPAGHEVRGHPGPQDRDPRRQRGDDLRGGDGPLR